MDMRRRLPVLVAMAALVLTGAWGQQAPESLPQANEDLEYAQLLNAAQLTAEQLGSLLEKQTTWEAEAMLDPEVAADLAEVRRRVLEGMTPEEAYAALGERQQAVGEAQARVQQTLQRLATELIELVTDEQMQSVARFASPARAVDGVVNAVSRGRAMPEQQRQQFQQNIVRNLTRMASQADPTAKVTEDAVAALLEAAWAIPDAEFEARRPGLTDEWVKTLMPGLHQRLQSPEFRQQRMAEVARRLITYPRGFELVEGKLEAMGAAQ
jgi:hypothetical protein